MDLNYELAPKPGTPASARKAELDQARFVAVRNLAYMIYKKPDTTPLMTYTETLDNRDLVKQTILNHEIALGIVVPDGSTAAVAVPQQQMQPNPQNGATMQPMQFSPPPAASPAQAAAAPMAAPQQQFAPPQQQFQQPPQAPQQMQGAPVAATPQDAAAAPATGRGRRRGSAVAPPPAGPAPMMAPPQAPQQQMMPAAVTQFQPPGAAAPQQPQFLTGMQQVPPQQFQPAPQMAPPQQPMPQQPQAMGVDLGPVLARVDSLGKGLEVAAGNSDQALKAAQALFSELAQVKNTQLQILTALHHIYLTAPCASATEGKAGNLADFQAYLQKYIGPVPK